jgi:hypothetical protein
MRLIDATIDIHTPAARVAELLAGITVPSR